MDAENILKYPYTDVEGTPFEDWLDKKIDHKLNKLAKELGYKWEKGGRWVKKTRKYKRRKK